MSTIVKWIWILILAVLFFGNKAALVFIAEMAVFAILMLWKPQIFK